MSGVAVQALTTAGHSPANFGSCRAEAGLVGRQAKKVIDEVLGFWGLSATGVVRHGPRGQVAALPGGKSVV